MNKLLLAKDESLKSWPKPYIVRDGVGPFLKTCLDNFDVVFWSFYHKWGMAKMMKALQQHFSVSLELYCKFD
jgi:hypothetical protein